MYLKWKWNRTAEKNSLKTKKWSSKVGTKYTSRVIILKLIKCASKMATNFPLTNIDSIGMYGSIT